MEEKREPCVVCHRDRVGADLVLLIRTGKGGRREALACRDSEPCQLVASRRLERVGASQSGS